MSLGWSSNATATADLSFTSLTAQPASAFADRTISFQVSVRNSGPSAATGLVVSDSVPAKAQPDPLSSNCTMQAAGITR